MQEGPLRKAASFPPEEAGSAFPSPSPPLAQNPELSSVTLVSGKCMHTAAALDPVLKEFSHQVNLPRPGQCAIIACSLDLSAPCPGLPALEELRIA